MSNQIYREYKLKFYLNASHYIIINGQKGDIHPHTWEFTLSIRFGRSSFTEFNVFEKGISNYLVPYQNRILNEIEPFDAITPTLENMTEYFAGEFSRVIRGIDGILMQLEASETPTRSYILTLSESGDDENENESVSDQIRSDVMDAVLDRLVK